MNQTARGLVIASALLLVAAGCGSKGPAPGQGDQGLDEVSLATLFAPSRTSLLRSAALEALPADTWAVVVVPGIEHARSLLPMPGSGAPRDSHDGSHDGSRDDREVRRALARMLVDRLGYDLLDRERMAATGVDTRAPLALALLDAGTLAVVLPVKDLSAFTQSWQDNDAILVIHGNHAVLAISLVADEEIDPTSDSIRALPTVEPGDSLAAHPALRKAAASLTFGPDAAFFLNMEPLRELTRTRMSDMRKALEADDQGELGPNSDSSELLLESFQTRAMKVRMAGWQRLFDELIGPVQSVAVGIGASPAIRVQVVAELGERSRGWQRMRELPDELRAPAEHGASLTIKAPPALVPSLMAALTGEHDITVASKLVVELGGPRALDGMVKVVARSRARRKDLSTPAVTMQLGVRDPEVVQARLATADVPAGWSADVSGGFLVLESTPSQDQGARLARPLRDHAELFTGQRGALMTFVFDVHTARALLWAEPSFAGIIETIGVGSGLGFNAPEELLVELRKLEHQRAELWVQQDRRLGELERELELLLGTAAGTVSRRGSSLVMLVAQISESRGSGHILGKALQVWYERSEYSATGKRIATLDERIAALRDQINQAALGDGSLVDLFDTDPDPNAAMGNVWGGGVVNLPEVGPGSSPRRRTNAPVTSKNLHVTASIAGVQAAPGASLNRAALGEALLTLEPGLLACYAEHIQDYPRATGYVAVELRLDPSSGGGKASMIAGKPAASATDLEADELMACVGEAMSRMEIAATQSGTASVTLWFGSH